MKRKAASELTRREKRVALPKDRDLLDCEFGKTLLDSTPLTPSVLKVLLGYVPGPTIWGCKNNHSHFWRCDGDCLFCDFHFSTRFLRNIADAASTDGVFGADSRFMRVVNENKSWDYAEYPLGAGDKDPLWAKKALVEFTVACPKGLWEELKAERKSNKEWKKTTNMANSRAGKALNRFTGEKIEEHDILIGALEKAMLELQQFEEEGPWKCLKFMKEYLHSD